MGSQPKVLDSFVCGAAALVDVQTSRRKSGVMRRVNDQETRGRRGRRSSADEMKKEGKPHIFDCDERTKPRRFTSLAYNQRTRFTRTIHRYVGPLFLCRLSRRSPHDADSERTRYRVFLFAQHAPRNPPDLLDSQLFSALFSPSSPTRHPKLPSLCIFMTPTNLFFF